MQDHFKPRHEKTCFLHMQKPRRRLAAQLISAFVFATKIVPFRNFKPLAIFSGSTARFVSDLVGNPEDRFCRDAAHLIEEYH